MSATLRELLAERHVLDELIEDAGGNLTVNIEQAWDANTEAVPAKIESWALWVTRQENLADAIDVEIERLKRRKAVVRNAIERSKDELQRQMTMGGIEKVKGVLVTVAIQKNNPAVVGELSQDDLAAVYANGPAIAKQVPLSYKLDRVAALQAHRAGQPLPAGLTVEQSVSLRIR